MKKIKVNDLHKMPKSTHLPRYLRSEYRDYSCEFHRGIAFPKGTSKKTIYRWLMNECYISEQQYRPCYENDYYYSGSAGSFTDYEVHVRKNRVYIFKNYDI